MQRRCLGQSSNNRGGRRAPLPVAVRKGDQLASGNSCHRAPDAMFPWYALLLLMCFFLVVSSSMIFGVALAVPEFEEGGIYSKASDWYLLGLLLYELLVNEVRSHLSFSSFACQNLPFFLPCSSTTLVTRICTLWLLDPRFHLLCPSRPQRSFKGFVFLCYFSPKAAHTLISSILTPNSSFSKNCLRSGSGLASTAPRRSNRYPSSKVWIGACGQVEQPNVSSKNHHRTNK